jgi:sulfur relay (sulfurtransferase) DsrC/TusE family protein
MMKMLEEESVIADVSSARLFELFPDGGAAKQGVKIAGLTKPFGKGGY